MAFQGGSILIRFEGDTGSLDKSFTNAGKSMRAFSKEVDSTTEQSGGFMSRLGNVATFALGNLAATAIGTVISKLNEMVGSSKNAFIEYESVFTNLRILAPRFGQDANATAEKAKQLGKELRIGPVAAAEVMTNLFKSGLNLAQTEELMRRFTNEAITGKTAGMSLGDAVRNLASGYQMEISALMDRAGISENISSLLEKEANLRGLSLNKITDQQREQLKYEAFIRLTNQTMGASEKIAGTAIEANALNQQKTEEVTRIIGEKLGGLYRDIDNWQIRAKDSLIEWLKKLEGSGVTYDNAKAKIGEVLTYIKENEYILWGLNTAMGILSTTTTISLIPSMQAAAAAGWLAISPWLPLIGTLILVSATVAAIKWAWDSNFWGMRDTVQQFCKIAMLVIGVAIGIIALIFQSACNFIGDLWNNNFLGIQTATSWFMSGLSWYVEKYIGMVTSNFEKFAGYINWLIDNVIKPALSWIGDLLKMAGEAMGLKIGDFGGDYVKNGQPAREGKKTFITGENNLVPDAVNPGAPGLLIPSLRDPRLDNAPVHPIVDDIPYPMMEVTPNRYNGGPLAAGQMAVVGENPDGSWNSTTELFVPRTAGRILSNAELTEVMSGSRNTDGSIVIDARGAFIERGFLDQLKNYKYEIKQLLT